MANKSKSAAAKTIETREKPQVSPSFTGMKNVHVVESNSYKHGDDRIDNVKSIHITRPSESLIHSSKSLHGEEGVQSILDAKCDCAADAMNIPDVLEVVYTFNFPQSCSEFRKLLSTDWWIFDTYQWTQAPNGVNVNVTGFGKYVLRCPFIPCALCIGIDADAYNWTAPALKLDLEKVTADAAVPPANQAFQTNDIDSVQGRVKGNALVSHGVYTNLMKQFILMSMGVRVQFDCDNIVVDRPMRQVGTLSSQYVCEGTNSLVSPSADMSNLNEQLATNKEDYRVELAPSTDCGCSDTGVLKGAFAPQVQASPNNCSALGDGCVALPRVPLLPGMGIDIILYTLPGQEQSRDDLLRQACANTINPGFDLPTAIKAHYFATSWTGGGALTVLAPDGNVTIAVGDRIPYELLDISADGSTRNIRFPAYVAPTVPPAAPTFAAGADITASTANLEVSYTIGTTEVEVINHGRLQISFTVRGCFIRRHDLVHYFRLIGNKNPKLRQLMLENTAALNMLNAGVSHYATKMGWKANAGVAGLPEVKDLKSAKDKDEESDDEESDDELPPLTDLNSSLRRCKTGSRAGSGPARRRVP